MKLKRFSEPVWVDYPDAPKVRFQIRPMKFTDSLEVRSKIRQRVPTEIADQVGRKRTELLEDIDMGLFTWEVFNSILLGWEGIEVEDIDLKDVKEIKKAIFNEETLRNFILSKSEALLKAEEARMEAERKNSLNSQSGS